MSVDNNKMGRVLAGGALLLAPCVSCSTPVDLVWCSGCTPTAKANAALGRPAGVVYVGDTTARTVVAFNVYVDTTDTNPPKHVKTADAVATTATATTLATALIDYYHTAPVGWAKDDTLPYHHGNLYKNVNAGIDQQGMLNYFRDHSSVAQFVQRLTGLAGTFKIVDNNALPKTVFTVVFDDGSTIDIAVDLSATNAKFSVVPDSAFDSHGNKVLAQAQNGGVVIFRFTGPGNPSDYSDFLQQMSWLGYTMDMNGSGDHGIACQGGGAQPVHLCQRF